MPDTELLPDTESAPESAPRLTAELAYTPFFDLAFQQHSVPAVQELKLTNLTDHPLYDISCTFSSVPEMILPKTIRAEEIRSGETLALGVKDFGGDMDKHVAGIELNCDYLMSISEAVRGKLKLHVECNGETLLEQEYDVTAYAADQWTGFHVMPELLASFVTPNLDVIAELQACASEELRKATGDASIDGYAAGERVRERAYEICAAVYRAVHSWGIHYTRPAASLAEPGQRIRFADNIYQFKLATCLDTSLLFASVLEQCRLNPVILIQTGHAYIGCHLKDYYFPDLPLTDLQTIRKLVDLDDFLVFETTCTDSTTFSAAEALARTQHLNVDEEFDFAIDIHRARLSGIRPLPLKRSVDGLELEPFQSHVQELEQERLRSLLEQVDIPVSDNADAQPGRLRRWQQKLLDLSLRNRLLNVRDTKQVIPIACANIFDLEDQISSNDQFKILPLQDVLGDKDIHDFAMLRNCENKPDIVKMLASELKQNRLRAMLKPAELNKRLTAIYRQGKSDLEEGGVNTLFLAVGFLEWKEKESDRDPHLAPILLIPIQLKRKSIAEGFAISRLDEETIINETLLEYLNVPPFKLTIPGLSPLPTDKFGVDVETVMQIFKQTIKDMKGWEVREEARIGLFSFEKIIMWNDMKEREADLRKNPLVDHLIEGSGLFDDGVEIFPPEDIAKHLDLKNTFCPVSADSSQLAAIVYSGMGKNFVLYGPPGTGKSQTITNIIAHNLALGRRVLFVSEKKAALDVVHKRLSDIGLKPFCLELHSNKAGKTGVLKQFEEALNVPETASSAEWEKTADSLEKLRDELNLYINELHKVFPNGLSAYECFSRTFHLSESSAAGLAELAPEIDFLTQSREDRETLEEIVSELATKFKWTTSDALDTMRILDPVQWQPAIQTDILKTAGALVAAADELRERFAEAAPVFDMPPESTDLPAILKIAELAAFLPSASNIPAELIHADFAARADFLKDYLRNDRRRQELEDRLKTYRLDLFPNYDFTLVKERIERIEQEFFAVRIFKEHALLKELAPIKKEGGAKLTMKDLNAVLPFADEYNGLLRSLDSAGSRAEGLLGAYWNGGKPDWNAVETMLNDAEKIMGLALSIDGNGPLLGKLRAVLPDAKDIFASGSESIGKIRPLPDAAKRFRETLDDFSGHSASAAAQNDLEALRNAVQAVIDRKDDLMAALNYLVQAKEAADHGLAKLASALEKGNLDPADLASSFLEGCAAAMLNQIMAASPALCQFNGITHNERIRKFSELDNKYTRLSREIVIARLTKNLPGGRAGQCPEGTELGILKRECAKQRNQKPVRKLLELIPTIAPKLKPCFLMSPLSVAQYLPPDTAPFDLIVFDEASQIPVWDAIGVIARGRQLIVVGDPKQMPPTNFFQKQDTDDEDADTDEIEDQESILDECRPVMYETLLNWHYRSRHESLIAFSNHYYYDDRLFTFPSAISSDRFGIRFEFVPDGVYDRRGKRTNENEAKAIVKYVFSRLKQTVGTKQERSLGIVTFSQAQKDLIEDLIERERSADSDMRLEKYFSDQNVEPFFVKNLENVQGDERDVILFSIGYAPDASGSFAMNFGPLNKQGGERRLNVAITRAKEQVVVFSSIHAPQIDLLRTNAVGAVYLRRFLDYAEKGTQVQSPDGARKKARKLSEASSDGLATIIADFLAENGYETERNFGFSEYRIDLAVRDPNRPDKFLLAIECDGADYKAQRTTRDRVHLRTAVLQSLGWHTYRAWSVDWAFARKRAEKDLLQYLESLKNMPDEPETKPEPPADAASENDGDGQPDASSQETENTVENHIPSPQQHRREYVCWETPSSLDPDLFLAPEYRTLIRRQVMEIVQTEGPIYESLLKKRIAKAWGLQRIRTSTAAVLTECLPDGLTKTEKADEPVYWPKNLSPSDYSDYRVGPDDELKRNIDEIPPEEIANAMSEILANYGQCEQDALYRATLKVFGFSVLTNKALKYLGHAFAIR